MYLEPRLVLHPKPFTSSLAQTILIFRIQPVSVLDSLAQSVGHTWHPQEELFWTEVMVSRRRKWCQHAGALRLKCVMQLKLSIPGLNRQKMERCRTPPESQRRTALPRERSLGTLAIRPVNGCKLRRVPLARIGTNIPGRAARQAKAVLSGRCLSERNPGDQPANPADRSGWPVLACPIEHETGCKRRQGLGD